MYRDITQVYIGNPANLGTHTVGYQPAGVDRWMMTFMLQEVDDMATKSGARTLPGGAHGGRPSVPPNLGRQRNADLRHGGKRGERSEGRGHGNLGSSDHIDPFDNPDLDMSSFSLGLMPTCPVRSKWIGDIVRASPSRYGVFFISITSPSGFGVFIILGTSPSGHIEFIISDTSSSGHCEFIILGAPSSKDGFHFILHN
ncbi:hypothetical protein M9H77_31664 [Catharanthus roseus]|uniref:Uncharacterized protein n=1 Tax=Catharanthus roseus TaxID=4058 RepID=A0ACC0A0R2_CATRO|nr:hypothetical protein M9H77_31664 [Catharanthus roseus]